MDACQFAEFWKQQGYNVIQTKSCHWFNSQPFSFISIPYHRFVTPSRQELARVFLSGPGLAVRFPTEARENGRSGGLFVCSDRVYDLGSLDKKARNQTRRGLERNSVERIEFKDLATYGQSLNAATFVRQKRSRGTISKQAWRQYCEAANQIGDFEAWAAFVQGRLAAFVVTALVEDCFSILHQASATDCLAYYPNNALVFKVTQLKLGLHNVSYVSYGLLGLTDTGTLERFKFGMGFTLKRFRDQIVVNPGFKPLLGVGGGRLVRWMHRKQPDRDLWRKASRAIDLMNGDRETID